MSTQPAITALIPTLSNTQGLKKVVAWLREHNYPVVVVDNQPTAAKKKFCQQDGVTYLPQTQNQGFAIAVNLAAKQAQTDWLLILNDDIEFLDEQTLAVLEKTARQNNWVAVSPVLQKPSGQTENLGYTLLPQGKVKLNFDKTLLDSQALDGITAACLLIKKDVFEQLSGFDERFFAYLEDVDLFLRIKKAGYKFGVATQIKVIHNHQTTSSKMGNFKAKMDVRNWWLVILKNWDAKTWIKYWPQILLERLRNVSGLMKATFLS